ncbi:glycosyltransferase family 4 protein [Oryzomonas rubra]|uniref:Glycosyltransferase n=1 Tax=Oryzomonas rubra TaxID=2509454 RepID=A0A5A9XKM6_9BACT|nr:glycosyltransferase family 1 protein [Oryzomonas rubra]KAA0893320.1 glycosyltransferase [Oryzomonas rubra]
MTNLLRIGLIMQGGAGWMGGAEYIRNIILALASLPQETRATFEVNLLTNTATDENFIDSIKPHVTNVHYLDQIVPPKFPELILWSIKSRLLRISDQRYDVILNKFGLNFVYPATSWDCRFSLDKVVAWIPDFQHKHLPQYFSKRELHGREKTYSKLVHSSPMVVLSSKSAAVDFERFYPDFIKKTRVLSFKSVMRDMWVQGDPANVQAKYSLPDRFFLVSNQFWQHKGHLTVINALKLLKDNGVKPVIVCTGELNDYRQPKYASVVLDAIKSFGLEEQILLVGLIPKNDQIQLLRRSLALIQPSQFEGWSTVVEEARCLGKAMILSDIPVHLEQNPPESCFFECSSPAALAEVMADFWHSLTPGPDGGKETLARETNKKECNDFAMTFLAIARSYVENRVRDLNG